MEDAREFAQIVEFCFIPKEQHFVIRFLDNNSYVLKVADLPKKMLTKKPQWEDAAISPERDSILVQAGGDLRVIPFHIIHARGKQL